MKVKSKEIIQKLKNQEKENAKANVTFRLNVGLMNKLRKKCDADEISMNSVIEELIKDFLG